MLVIKLSYFWATATKIPTKKSLNGVVFCLLILAKSVHSLLTLYSWAAITWGKREPTTEWQITTKEYWYTSSHSRSRVRKYRKRLQQYTTSRNTCPTDLIPPVSP